MAMQDKGERHSLSKRTEASEEEGKKQETEVHGEAADQGAAEPGVGPAKVEEAEGTAGGLGGAGEGTQGGGGDGDAAAVQDGVSAAEGEAQGQGHAGDEYNDEGFEEDEDGGSKHGENSVGGKEGNKGSVDRGGGGSAASGKGKQGEEPSKQGEKAKSGPVPPLKITSPYHLRFNRQPGGSLTERAILPKGFYQPPLPGEGSLSARLPPNQGGKKDKKDRKATPLAKNEGSFENKQSGVLSFGSTSFEKLNQKSDEKHYMERLFGPKGPLLTYGCKQRYVALPGSRPEGVLKMPFGRYFEKLDPFEVRAEESDSSINSMKREANVLEDVEHSVSLINFEEHPTARINSPLSLRAMETLGSITEDLADKTLEEMTAEAGGDEEMGQLRFEYYSKARSTLISTLREQRLKLERAQQGLGPRELGQIQENQGSRKLAVNALTAKMIERGKLNREKVEMMERRRMEALLKSHIAAKDRVKDLQQRLEDKFHAKEKLVREMRAKLKEHNQLKVQQYEEKHRMLMQKLEEENAQKLKALQDRAEQAEINCAKATHRVVRKLQEKTELHKMRNERHHLKMVMASRVIETGLKKRVQKHLDGDELLEKRREYREGILAERDDMYRKLMWDRKLFGEVVEDFRKTGKFPKLATEIDLVNQFLQLNPDAVPRDFSDKNPQAMLLQRNQTIHTTVKRGDYMFFKFVHNTMDCVRIVLKATEGDPDLYVGNHLCPYPNHMEYVWKKEDHGDDKIVVHGFEKHFVVGFMYIGVRGTSKTVFSICVKWREERGASKTTSEIPVVAPPTEDEGNKQEPKELHESAPADLEGALAQGVESSSVAKSEKGSERGESERKFERRVSIGEEPVFRAQSSGEVSDKSLGQDEPAAKAAGDAKREGSKHDNGKRKVTHSRSVSIRVASQSVDASEEEAGGAQKLDRDAWLKRLTYTKVCEWLAALGVNENSIQKVREDRVPGSQIMLMDVNELMEELAMTKLQAVRVFKRDKELMAMPTGHGIDMDELLDWEDDEPPPLPPPTVVEEVVEKVEPQIKSLDKMNFLF